MGRVENMLTSRKVSASAQMSLYIVLATAISSYGTSSGAAHAHDAPDPEVVYPCSLVMRETPKSISLAAPSSSTITFDWRMGFRSQRGDVERGGGRLNEPP